MAKRMVRIFPNAFYEELGLLVGREVNVILNNNQTIFGRVIGVESAHLLLQDLRFHRHRPHFDNIAEVLYDQVASF
jgi:antitoxin component of MazEF toxin-antitoxin module